MGETAQQSRSSQRTLFQPAALNIPGVFKTFKDISNLHGKDAGNNRKKKIKSLLVACRGGEAKYMTRALQGNLRIGLQAKTVLAALSRAVVNIYIYIYIGLLGLSGLLGHKLRRMCVSLVQLTIITLIIHVIFTHMITLRS